MNSEYTFYFCQDGVLRVKYFSSTTLLDATFLRKRYTSDFSFFMSLWDKPAHFERGLTVGKFLSCLSPFADFWSEYTHCALGEFIEESKKPVLVENNRTHEFDWIEISWDHCVATALQYESLDKKDFQSSEAYFNQERRVKVLDTVEFRRHLKATGYYANESEHYCVHGIELNRLAHTPIYLREYEDIVFEDYLAHKYLAQQTNAAPILNPQSLVVFSHKRQHYEHQWLKAKAFYSLKDVVDGFFGDMEGTIAQRDHNANTIRQVIDRINLEEKPTTLNLVVSNGVEIGPTLESNIVSLSEKRAQKKSQTCEGQTPPDILTVDKEENKTQGATIIDTPELFNPLIESIHKQLHIWDDMTAELSLEQDLIKRGHIEAQVSPDYRVNGEAVILEDRSTDWIKR